MLEMRAGILTLFDWQLPPLLGVRTEFWPVLSLTPKSTSGRPVFVRTLKSSLNSRQA